MRDTWSHGAIFNAELSTSTAAYTAGYVTKKLTQGDAWEMYLLGRHPEFQRQSLKPGIGFSAMWEVADTLMQFNLDTSSADVPSALDHGGRSMPLGRYLRRSLRKMIGKDEKTPQPILDELHQKMLLVYAASIENKTSFKKEITSQNLGSYNRFLSRTQIYDQRRITL